MIADWRDVEIVLANGEQRPAKACYVGDGWCDVIVESGEMTARLWVLADGSTDLPMNPCRLAKPFPVSPRPALTNQAPLAPEDIMFWLSGIVTAPGTLAGVVRDTATAIRDGKNRRYLARTYVQAANVSRDFGDASGAQAFRFLAALLLYSEARRG